MAHTFKQLHANTGNRELRNQLTYAHVSKSSYPHKAVKTFKTENTITKDHIHEHDDTNPIHRQQPVAFEHNKALAVTATGYTRSAQRKIHALSYRLRHINLLPGSARFSIRMFLVQNLLSFLP